MESWPELPERLNELTYKIIGAAMAVHQALGAGLLERVYENALSVELEQQGIPFQRQVPVRVMYKGVQVGKGSIDLLVDETIVVELKVVRRIIDAHVAQVLTYLQAGGYPLGLILNFGVARLKDGGIRRVILSQKET